jgi:hypothetical protein
MMGKALPSWCCMLLFLNNNHGVSVAILNCAMVGYTLPMWSLETIKGFFTAPWFKVVDEISSGRT